MIARQRRRALAGAGIGKPGKADHQRPGADHQVEIDLEHLCQGARLQQSRPVQHAAGQPALALQRDAGQHKTQQQANPFRNRGGGAHAARAVAQSQHEPQVQRDIDQAEGDIDRQGRGIAAQPDQPA